MIITTITINDKKTLKFKGFVKANSLKYRLDDKAHSIVMFSNVPTEFKELVLAQSSSLVYGMDVLDVDIIYDATEEDTITATATYDEIAAEINKFCAKM